MKAIRCPKGHWYDADRYAVCPHCKDIMPMNQQRVPQQRVPQQMAPQQMAPQQRVPQQRVPQQMVPQQMAPQQRVPQQGVPQQRQPMPGARPQVQPQGNANTAFFNQIKEQPVAKNPQNNSGSATLADSVKRVSAMDNGKTLSYFNALTAEPESSETKNTAEKRVFEPVVGWVVAVAGPHMGDSFKLHTGKNSVGRNSSNKVVLELDKSVSRESHAIVIYEPKNREFYVQAGSSDSLVYLNEKFLNEMHQINANDVFEIGATKLMLVPLCGSQFTWENFMKKD